MGYISAVTGSLDFSRILNQSEYDALYMALGQTSGGEEYPFSVDTSGIYTDDVDSGKYYHLEADLKILLGALPSDVEVTGFIERIGEQWPDAERLYAMPTTRQVMSVRASITWIGPGGQTETITSE